LISRQSANLTNQHVWLVTATDQQAILPKNIDPHVTKKSLKRINCGFSLWGDEHGIKDALLLTPECACLNINEF
jgi:hypothetical protein